MTALSRWLAVAAAFITLAGPNLTAAPVPAAGDPAMAALAIVPAQAPIVVHLRGVERTKERMTSFLKIAVPDFGPIAANQIDEMLKTGFDGRKLAGLDKDGPVFLAVLEMPTAGGGEPPVAVIARVTGYAAFRDGLLTEDERKGIKAEAGYEKADLNGRETYFIDRQGFAAVTTSKDAATLLGKKPAGLDGKLSAGLAKQFLSNDVSVYVDLAAVNKEYGDQIKGGQQLMEALLDQAAGGAEKASMEYAKIVYKGMFQAIADGRTFMAGFDFRPEGLNLHLQFEVGPDTKTNQYLRDQKPSALESIATLPGGLMSYSASRMMGELLRSMAPMLYGAMGGDGDSKAQIEAAVKQLLAAGSNGSIAGTNIPASGVQVQSFDDSAKAMAATLALFRAMGDGGTFQSAYLKGKPEIKENAQEVGGFKLTAVHMAWDLDKFADAIPGGGEAAKTAMKKLMGEDLNLWFGTDGKRVVTVSAKNWDEARTQLDAFLAGTKTLASDPAFAMTRKQLPAETSMLVLSDAGRVTQVMGNYMLAMFKAMPAQLPFNLPDSIKPVPTKTSYLGFAVTLRPETAGLDIFVPVIAVQEIRKVIMPLFLGGA